MLFIKRSETVYASTDVKRLTLLYQHVHFRNCSYKLKRLSATDTSIRIKLSPEFEPPRYRGILLPYADISVKEEDQQSLSVDAKFSYHPIVYVILAVMTVFCPIMQIFILMDNKTSGLTVNSFFPLIFLAASYFIYYYLFSASSKALFGMITSKLKRL